MEAMISIAQPSGAPAPLSDGPGSSLDELALEKARDQHRPRDEDERSREPALEPELAKYQLAWQAQQPQALALRRRNESVPTEVEIKVGTTDRQDRLELANEPDKKDKSPLLDARPGKLALAAIGLRAQKHGDVALAMNDARQGKPVLAEGEQQRGEPLGDFLLTKRDARVGMLMPFVAGQGPIQEGEQDLNLQVVRQSAVELGEPALARSKDALSRMKKNASPHTVPLASPQPMPDLIPLTQASSHAERLRAAKQAPAAAQRRMSGEATASTVGTAAPATQNGLTYQFRRWGNEHSVTVQGGLSGSLLLQPSDALVAQRLGEQWQSGNPQQWQLARDGGEGRGQQQPRQDEEDESGC
ncbi:hypothetical protein C2134_00660 [Chromobacterium sinusclupearum]|uniref:Surface presentation of antigen domain-containing protein n=1 Tax=Chromobacterium sinusclupearum TaxID=2077146 RepID=A0A2K4MU50_9NEIS|nr:type III secretion system needle length determinant, SpaN/EivJ family [Chromobacterium sinusclupearum]POB00614.1 hypothetical protein C2134_00660 [Chromobacterium sinusclupearum]